MTTSPTPLARSLLAATLLVTFAVPAFAYIDPGAGSIAIQLIIAGVLAMAYRLRAWFGRAADWMRRRLGKSASSREDREDQ